MARRWVPYALLGLLSFLLLSNTRVEASTELTMLLLMQMKDLGWVLKKALDAYPPNLAGQSPYDNTYNLTAKCHQSLLVYDAAILIGQNWPGLMMDSDGTPPSGIISGHIHWLGSHEQCVEAKATENNVFVAGQGLNMTHDFDAKYCRSYFSFSPEGPTASVGVCLPEYCTRDDVTHILRVGNGSLPVFYTYCGEQQELKDDAGAIVAIVISSSFAFVVLAATIVDYVLKWHNDRRNKLANPGVDLKQIEESCDKEKEVPTAHAATNNGVSLVETLNVADIKTIELNPVKLTGSVEGDRRVEEHKISSTFTLTKTSVPQKKQQYGKPLRALLAFSLRRNVPRVLSTRMPPGAYLAFNGIRFLSMAWIILGHTWQLGIYVVPYTGPLPINGVENIYSQYKHLVRWTHCVINNMHLAVDTFLLLGSCLVTISFMRQLDKQDGKPTVRQMTMHYIHRYLRLTPVYAIIIMMFTTLFYHWNTGPLAPETLSDIEYCQSNWWANFLYIQNLYKPDEMCMGWSWYLAIDFQYFVIAPLFVFLIYKYTIPGAIFLFLGYCGALVARIVLHHDDSVLHFLDIYIKPWTRFGPYAIGIGLGYLLFRTKCKVNIHIVGVITGWILAVAACLLAVYGNYNRDVCIDCKPWSASLEAAYYSTYRDLFSLGIAWLMFACCTGYGGIANTFLSWEGFIPASRLTYVGYLVHPIIIYLNYYSAQRAIYVEDLSMITMFCAHLTLTLAASFVLTLLFEVPMLELEKILLPARKKKD